MTGWCKVVSFIRNGMTVEDSRLGGNIENSGISKWDITKWKYIVDMSGLQKRYFA